VTAVAPHAFAPSLPATLRLPSSIAEMIVAHARGELPNEACGLLSGDGTTVTARAYHASRNLHRSPWRFEVDPRDLVRLVLAIERGGDQLLAIVHSHPATPAVPSPADVREARYPTLQLVVGLATPATPDLRAWRIERAGPVEVGVRIG